MIEINNLTTKPIDENFLKKIAEKVLEKEGKRGANLSLALVGSGRMRKLNKKYRGKNRVTDVLAFPESKVFLEKFQVGPLKKFSGLGEIVICLREVKKNAKRLNLTFEKELATCLIHGILHLLGYDHEKSKEAAKEMEEKQNYYLAQFF
jgi:rRNA maturation RNase YbeY